MDKNQLTPEESFNIISKAIANFRMNYRESSKRFLLWGWIISLANISHFIILKVLLNREAYKLIGIFSIGNWVFFILLGFILMYFSQKKSLANKKATSYLDNYIQKLWIVAAISFFISGFISIKLGFDPPAFILLIAGIATTITGLVIKFNPLTIGGIAFFGFSIACTFVSRENTLLISAAAVICGYLIPGYLLRSAKE